MQPDQHRLIAGEATRFCVVGLLSVALNNLVIVLLTEVVGFHYLLSIALCFVMATVLGFLLNRGWSFRKQDEAQWREMIRYLVVTLIGIGIALPGTYQLVQIGVPYYMAMVGLALLLAPLNFILHRAWSFGLPSPLTGGRKAG